MKYTYRQLKNPTTKDLEFYWDSERYEVKAGSTELFPDFLALHGAKALADKNWTKPLDNGGKEKLIQSYLGETQGVVTGVQKMTLREEMALDKRQLEQPKEEEFAGLKDLEKAPFCTFCTSRGVKHLNSCTRPK